MRLLSLLPLLPFAAFASCGAHFCPRPQEAASSAWQARWTVERAAYELAGASGSYSIAMLDVRYFHADRWIAALHIPYIALQAAGDRKFGLGNPMALAEYRWHPSADRTFGAGAQLELPLGDDAHGLAQPHYMAVPYLSASARWGGFFMGGTTGVSLAFGGDHESMAGMAGMDMPMAPASPIHPHEDREAIYRISAGAEARAWHARPEAFVNGQHVLSEDRKQGSADDYVTAGIAVPIALGRIEIAPEGEVPVTSGHRFEWSLSLSCGVRF